MHFFLVHDLFDVFGWSQPNCFPLGEIAEAWRQMQFTNSLYGLLLRELAPFTAFILLKSLFEIMGSGLLIAWPLWQHCKRLKFVTPGDLGFTFHTSHLALTRLLGICGQDILQGFASLKVPGYLPLLCFFSFWWHSIESM